MLHETSGRRDFCPAPAAEVVQGRDGHAEKEKRVQVELVSLDILLPSGAKLSLCCSWDTKLEKLPGYSELQGDGAIGLWS